MGELVNLLKAQAKLYDGPPRHMDPTFGVAYFDGTRDTGYGGYTSDGRWKPVCEAIQQRYDLQPGATVLDIGCAKGFFLAACLEVCPGVQVRGIDVSSYALSHAPASVQPFLSLGSADDLSAFPDQTFDFVAAMNSLHFLPPERVKVALAEMLRVGRGKFFVQVDAYTTASERERLLAWAPIIKTVYSVDQWLALFRDVGYEGDYYWTFVRPLAA
jgi:SAM-dependent methyltransferase